MTAVLEVVLGLGFVFLLFSTVASAVVEWLSALLERRADTLHDALVSTLGAHLATELLAHPVIAGIRPGPPQRPPPHYLSPTAVALALADIARQPEPPKTKEDTIARERLRGLLRALKNESAPWPKKHAGEPSLKHEGEPRPDVVSLAMDAEVLYRVERWFTEQMDRTTGTYKRWTQVWTVAVAVVLTVGFDLDSGRIAAELHRNAAARTALAGRVAGEIAGKTLPDLDLSISRLETLPVGWSRAPGDLVRGGAWRVGAAIAGWLITIVALGVGAPFWFDTLNRIINLRQTGPRPNPGIVA
jgi:hypothetical protein